MDGSVRQILDPRILSASYQQLPPQSPTPLTDAFFRDPEPIDDDSFRSMYDPYDSTPAPGNISGAEARTISLGDAEERLFTMILTFNKMKVPSTVLQALREPDSYTLQNMGRTEVRRVMNKFDNRHRLFKEVSISKIITTGKLYMDAGGNILESSSGAATSCEFDVPSSNQGNLGGMISAKFDIAGTDIPSILEDIADEAATQNVQAPTDVWVNKVNLQSLRNNTKFQTWAQYNNAATTTVLRGGMIEDLWGLNWHFITGKYRGSDGNMKDLIPATGTGSLVLTPPVSGQWLKSSNGLTLLPRSIDVEQGWEAALSNAEKAYGRFSYARLKDDPVAIVMYMGDKFGLHFNEPKAIWQADAFGA